MLLITLFEQLRHFTRTGNYAERIQRALPKRVQEVSLLVGGAHGDIEAVFDYAPDTKLLAAAARADEWHDDDTAGQSGITDRSGSGLGGLRGEEHEDSDIEATDSDEADSVGALPIIARDHASPEVPTGGILSSSPQQTRAQITFEQSDTDTGRRRSYPPTGPGSVPGPKRKERQNSSSVLQRLYGHATTQESAGARSGGWDATPPSWVLELNATLRGIEERQRHLEQILGGAKDPDSASVNSAGTDLEGS